MLFSKSNFIRAQFCDKAMWLDVHRPGLVAVSDSARRVLEQGREVGALARTLFEDGMLIHDGERSLGDSAAMTREAMAAGEDFLFEAVFVFDEALVVSDILEPLEDGTWHLLEVKSTTSVKDNHILDLAMQKWAIEGNGFEVSQCSVVVYNATFERGVITNLADAFPQHAERLLDIADRLFDQMPIIRNYYHHHAFGASNSLKAVLPVIAPDLSYNNLTIADGGHASAAWQDMVYSQDPEEKQQLRDALLAYCKLDTLAMVKIHEHLTSLI